MWVVAGVLLGIVLLTSLAGFHLGPHAHIVAGAVGVIAALWLVFMAADGRAAPLLWVLLSADVVVSAGVGILAWYGLSGHSTTGYRLNHLQGGEGIAVNDLAPKGIVRVRGEQWSAVSVNGTVRAGGKVQVLGVSGVHLDVWGEDAENDAAAHPFQLDEGESKEHTS
jgi:membrane protein implicated in regulation of membrane protease activity